MGDLVTRVPAQKLGEPTYDSPLAARFREGEFVSDDLFAFAFDDVDKLGTPEALAFEHAGPRQRIYHNPFDTRVGIVTCGGLCPGLNNVIRSATQELRWNYGVTRVYGIKYGYEGLNPECGHEPIDLTIDYVDSIHHAGGTKLGSSRGHQPPEAMCEQLRRFGINVLLCIGGDGTQRGAHALQLETEKRGMKVSIVGIPKTIDNDVAYCDRSFGVTTAVAEAVRALNAAHEEARGAYNGIGLVKLMGRDAGFIAAMATVASQEVNFTLIPEQPFKLEGERGFLALLEKRLKARQHALVVVAEGAGQDLFDQEALGYDKSGNRRYGDIGLLLREKIEEYFRSKQIPVAIKYIDPSYTIRSVPANSEDAALCDQYARQAVHAAMAGKTDMVVSSTRGNFVHVPSELVTATKRRLSLTSYLWRAVLSSTRQPAVIG
jgi:6-phosphofructokinase 1